QSPREHRLRHAGHIFQQNVPFGEVRSERKGKLWALPDDDLLDVGDNASGNARHVCCHTAVPGVGVSSSSLRGKTLLACNDSGFADQSMQFFREPTILAKCLLRVRSTIRLSY